MYSFGMLALSPQDRILVVSPHPDDDAVACGGLLQRAVLEAEAVRLVYATNGDERIFRPWRGRPVLLPSAVRRLGRTRQREAIEGARAMGLAPEQLAFLGYPDRGILRLWLAHWRGRPPFRNPLTRADRVPYDGALGPGTPYEAERLLEDLKRIVREAKPTKVFAPHPADHHPDHRALHCFVQAALWDLEGELSAELLGYLVHFRRWPRPRGYFPGAPLRPPEGLRPSGRWLAYPLDEELVRRKRNAALAHQTQWRFSPQALRSCIKRNELFDELRGPRFGAPGVFMPFLGSTLGAAGIEYASASLLAQELRLRVRLDLWLSAAGGASIHIFGHRRGAPFSAMPKLRVVAGRWTTRVDDGGRPLPPAAVKSAWRGRDLELAVPLELLGRPQRFLISVQATLGRTALGRECWCPLQ